MLPEAAVAEPTNPGSGPISTDVVAATVAMARHGRCLDLILGCLAITSATFRVIADKMGLESPATTEFRPGKHPKAWTLRDYRTLTELWLGNQRAADIASALGRSKGSVYAKRRFLALPKRDRRLLADVTGSHIGPNGSRGAVSDGILTAEQVRALAPHERRGKSWRVDRSDLIISMKQKRDELVWTQPMFDEIALRHMALQHPKQNALDWGVSLITIKSAIFWQELPERDRSKLVTGFDREVGLMNLGSSGYIRKKCAKLENWSFWAPERGGSRLSRRYKSSKAYADAIALA